MQIHRSGPLKQQNKSHKHGKHKSKGQREEGGRVNAKVLSKKALTVKRKNDRKHQAVQLRKRKREEAVAKKRSVGVSGTPPHCVLVVPLHGEVSASSVVEKISSCDDTLTATKTESGITHVSVPRFKQRVEFVTVKHGDLYSTLDGAKGADSVMFVMSSEAGLDSYGESCLSCLMGQGMPSVTLIIQGLKDLPLKRQKEVRKFLQKTVEKWFPNDKLHTVDTEQDCLLVLRHVTSQKLRDIHYRENRPHLLAEDVHFELSNDSETHGTLKLTGYIRSQAMSVNRLVHISGLGDFQLAQIDVLNDPHPLQPRSDRHKQKTDTAQDSEMKEDPMNVEAVSVLRPDSSKQESLDSEVVPDPMEGEQTWPTEEELAEAEGNHQKVTRRVPKGTSDYQAFWILDDEEDNDEKLDEEDDNDDDFEDDTEMAAMDDQDDDDNDEDVDSVELSESEEEYEDLTVEEDKDVKYDQQMDMAEEQSVFAKLKQERQHVMFPDEIDTPQDLPARTRFQKYRGLKSFRTSPWDAKENLPFDYAKIFQFNNFKRMTRKILYNAVDEEELDSSVLAWTYVRLHIANVPKFFIDSHQTDTPVVVFGLLPHEQKMSVINIVLHKSHDVGRPIKSKDKLIFHIGCRRFTANPIFSQHTNGNKHKCERFLPQDSAAVATIFAPISFPPAPVLVFEDRPFGEIELVAKGSLLSVDPDRIIVKRAVLSGHPLKIHKKSCVVRYMFFNREDINWFKPVELRTKWGRRGHIKEPLGTHGHMKCVFDGQLKSQDTILMNLYKRVFPKWTYNPTVSRPTSIARSTNFVSMETIEEEDEEKEGAAFAMFD
ncbi:pre-rRNA-processing protein TSR1 homolog [Mercenaria mercenaria]|uniref:pre-rRNA-processing protein TSR1 homolog n=1 Tax=Mercenaria mercenaria TaxID=6596 RepID=UPI00234F03E8|nr:pre-rRNA-processing protein TSR1 homolog [Mercenaria mercenaria]